jgi:uncharacterized protein (DUF2062 family)
MHTLHKLHKALSISLILAGFQPNGVVSVLAAMLLSRPPASLTCWWLEYADGAWTMDAQHQALQHTEMVVQIGAFNERHREVERHGEIHVLWTTIKQQRARLG